MALTRRDLLKAAAALVVEQWAGAHRLAFGEHRASAGRKVGLKNINLPGKPLPGLWL
jgi:hypothetical protein